MSATILRADAGRLPLADSTVDLIVTSPPYWALRSYTDGGEHYTGQIGSEATPAAYIDSLIECTAEWMRVLKPGGSIWVNLGDKYSDRGHGPSRGRGTSRGPQAEMLPQTRGPQEKSLLLLPERYRIACVDRLGLIARAVVIWNKPNVRRSHEDWVHLVKQPRYFAAVDVIRAPHSPTTHPGRTRTVGSESGNGVRHRTFAGNSDMFNPLGKLPGSVREVASQPLRVPAELGVDHFAAFPMDWPRWIIAGWSPSGICMACGEGRRPITERGPRVDRRPSKHSEYPVHHSGHETRTLDVVPDYRIVGESCACPDASAPARPSVVLDPFGGTGTTALVADVLGRRGVSVDMSADYCRLAAWRTADPGQRAAAMQVEKPRVERPGQLDLFGASGGGQP